MCPLPGVHSVEEVNRTHAIVILVGGANGNSDLASSSHKSLERVSTREWAEGNDYDASKLFHKVRGCGSMCQVLKVGVAVVPQ